MNLETLAAKAVKAAQDGRNQDARKLCGLLSFAPASDEIRSVVGMVYFSIKDMPAALAELSRVKEKSRAVWACMAIAYRAAGDSASCEICLRNSHILEPEIFGERRELIQKLAAGDAYERAVAECMTYAATVEQLSGPPTTAVPKWNGEQVDRLAVLFTAGLGDTFLCGRYLAGLKSKARHTVAIIRPAELPLVARCAPVEVVAEKDQDSVLRRVDAYVADMDLSWLSGERYGVAEWIHPEPERAARWRPLGDGPHVGICWNGSITHLRDDLRSIPVAMLEPLFTIPGITWHSLQVGPRAADCPAGVINYSARIKGFEDTAALIAGLDLVVSVDTAVANLAGAMGKPVWLLDYGRDFRWRGEGEHTPWFKSARVFRQSTAGDWAGVVERVRGALVSVATRRNR
jgi:hypothetical protein